jgi:SHS2 domain-containing protein
MRPYKLLEHTSEVGLEVRGRDLAILFRNAAAGLMELMGRDGKVREEETVSIRVRSSSAETLLLHWLSELIYLVQTRRWLYHRIEFTRLGDTHLTAELHGERLAEGRHRLGREVKAVTFHDLRIHRDGDALRAQVLFDV